MAKGSLRIRKKKQQRKQAQTLSRQYSPKQIKKMPAEQRAKEEKRINRNLDRQKSRQESKSFFLGKGFSERFINKYRLQDKKIDSYSSGDILTLSKMFRLESAGYMDFTKSDLRLGWVKLKQKFPDISIPDKYEKQYQKILDNEVHTCDLFLYIGVAVLDAPFIIQDYSKESSDELGTLIMERVMEAREDQNAYPHQFCVFVYDMGNRETMQMKANAFYKRGYNMSALTPKTDVKSFSKLTVSNRWKQHVFLSMVLNVINQMKNSDVKNFMTFIIAYCRRNGLPFIDKIK